MSEECPMYGSQGMTREQVIADRRFKRLWVAPQLLLRLATTGDALRLVAGIPDGAVVAHSYFDDKVGAFAIILAHEAFPPVPVGEMVPMLTDVLVEYVAAAGGPVPMLLYCPRCAMQHVDAPQPEKGWDNPPHRSHECQGCGYVWRPADVATVGVERIATVGQRDLPSKPWSEHDRAMEATGGPAGGVTVAPR